MCSFLNLYPEDSNKYSSLTLDPMEESLTEFPEVQRVSEGVDEFIQNELQDVQPAKYFESSREVPSLTLDPMEELLMEPPVTSQETTGDEFLQTDLEDVPTFNLLLGQARRTFINVGSDGRIIYEPTGKFTGSS